MNGRNIFSFKIYNYSMQLPVRVDFTRHGIEIARPQIIIKKEIEVKTWQLHIKEVSLWGWY